MPATGDSPIFLGGADRSGIGLLGEILECHPDVSMTRRTNFWPYYAGRFADLSTEGALDRCLSVLAADSRMDPLTSGVASSMIDFGEEPADFVNLFGRLQHLRMHRMGAGRWGDKSLGSERYASELLAAYPLARFVHVVRDPRDRVASVKHHRGLSRGGIPAAALAGADSMRHAETNRRSHAGRYEVVRYEDLVAEPEATLERVAAFLGLPSPDPDACPPAEPIVTVSVGRHVSDLTDGERGLVEAATGSGMAAWGYEVPPRQVSGVRRWTASAAIGARLAVARAVRRARRGETGPSRTRLTPRTVERST